MTSRQILRIVLAGAVLLAVAASFSAFGRYVRRAHAKRGCANNLQQIGLALFAYANANEGRLPDSLETLAMNSQLTPVVFVCPLTDDVEVVAATSRAVAEQLTEGGHLSHVYTGGGLSMAEVTGDTILAYEPLANHGDGMNALFGDGHVKFLDARRGKVVAGRAAAGLRPVVRPP